MSLDYWTSGRLLALPTRAGSVTMAAREAALVRSAMFRSTYCGGAGALAAGRSGRGLSMGSSVSSSVPLPLVLSRISSALFFAMALVLLWLAVLTVRHAG